MKIEFGEKFTPLLKSFKHKALFGGRGSAKTHHIGAALVILAGRSKKKVTCGRQFQNSIAESSKQIIEQKINELGMSYRFKITEKNIECVANGSIFSFIGMDRNPESMKSLEGSDIFWNEEAQTTRKKSWEIALPTFLRKPGSEIWTSWNPRFRDDPVDAYYRSGSPPRNAYIQKVTQSDNPWFYQTELPAQMEHCRINDTARFEHIWGGEYDENSEARIFTNIEVGRVEVPDNTQPLFGLDFGFSESPNALVKLYVLHETRTIFIAQEAFGKVSLPDLAALLDGVSESREYAITADAARPETIDYLNGMGFSVHSCRKGAGSIKAGINWLQGFKIVIDPDCINMIEESRRYYWKTDRDGKTLPVTDPHFDHGWDAVRYAVEDEMRNSRDANEGDSGIIKFRI